MGYLNDVLHLTPRATAPSLPEQGDIYLGEDDKLHIYIHGDWRIIVIE